MEKVTVWDISIRIFHWTLVFLFFVAYVSEDLETIHVYAGYGIIILLGYRFVWGVIGTPYARFSSFLFGPVRTVEYLLSLFSGRPKHYLGHNPIGAISVFVLLFCLIAISWTGLKLYAVEGKGPLAQDVPSFVTQAYANGKKRRGRHGGDDDDEGENKKGKEAEEDYWEELHETVANITLFFVFLHICGVLASSYIHEENLIGSMISGKKDKKSE